MSHWNYARKNLPPNDKDRVLISVDGICYMATYEASERVFRVLGGTGQKFPIDEKLIYWTSPGKVLGSPPKGGL